MADPNILKLLDLKKKLLDFFPFSAFPFPLFRYCTTESNPNNFNKIIFDLNFIFNKYN